MFICMFACMCICMFICYNMCVYMLLLLVLTDACRTRGGLSGEKIQLASDA